MALVKFWSPFLRLLRLLHNDTISQGDPVVFDDLLTFAVRAVHRL